MSDYFDHLRALCQQTHHIITETNPVARELRFMGAAADLMKRATKSGVMDYAIFDQALAAFASARLARLPAPKPQHVVQPPEETDGTRPTTTDAEAPDSDALPSISLEDEGPSPAPSGHTDPSTDQAPDGPPGGDEPEGAAPSPTPDPAEAPGDGPQEEDDDDWEEDSSPTQGDPKY